MTTPSELELRMRATLSAGELDLPLPAGGETAERHRSLAELGRSDLSVGRLAEAHTDAVAILASTGRTVRPDSLYGVWASERPDQRVRLDRSSDTWTLDGVKSFCTGVDLCDMALVTVWADGDDSPQLVEVDVRGAVARGTAVTDTGDWASSAFAATSTGSIDFRGHVVDVTSLVGGPGWYLDRPGFWHGAVGPAAVWAGGALGLVDAAERGVRGSPHALAELGALRSLAWSLDSILQSAGDQIDADPEDVVRAQRRALIVRALVDRTASSIVDHFGRAVGPGPLAFDAAVARRHAELQLYVRQSHGGDDLEVIGRIDASSGPSNG